VDFQEADRILTLLTPDHGKLSVIAKGVRKPRSKLAGGIELLSVSNVSILQGRGSVATLISSRLDIHYGEITKDIKRTMLAYDFLKRTNKVTEEGAEEEYFELLNNSLNGLNEISVPVPVVDLWYNSRLLSTLGYSPNVSTDDSGKKLAESKSYIFDYASSSFSENQQGQFVVNDIKLLRLALSSSASPRKLGMIKDSEKYVSNVLALVKSLLQQSVRI